MEIKTKFNVGDKVWFVAFDNIAYDCPLCDEETYDVKPRGVMQGEIEEITITHNLTRHEESYKVVCGRYNSGLCAFTDRHADRVYATQHEAEQAYATELAEYEEDLWAEKNRVAEWFAERYDGIKKPTASQ